MANNSEVVEIHHGSGDSEAIEAAVRAAFPRGQLLRAQVVIDRQAGGVPHEKWLALINTQRTYGHFGVLEWDPQVGGLFGGHYFDSITEVVADFNNRGGDIKMVTT